MAASAAASWTTRLPDNCAARVLQALDGVSLARSGRCCVRLRRLTDDGGDEADAPSLAGQTWRALCSRFDLHQPGTRTRGWRRWSAIYYAQVCIECASPGKVTIRDAVLGFPNDRFALCAECVKSAHLWRVARRPELRGEKARLDHLLFRIATIRRELGLAADPKKRKGTRHAVHRILS